LQIYRGDIVTVELNPTKGSEQQGSSRPSVVIQNDIGNKNSPTTIIAPLTTQYNSGNTYPFEVELLSKNTGLNSDSVVDLSQIRVVDVSSRIHKKISSVPASKIPHIDRAIETSLGL
jgi:mRNA interferase MazF